MNLNSKLGQIDRVANIAMGAAMVGYAFLGSIEKMPIQVAVVGIGLVFIVGGIGGT